MDPQPDLIRQQIEETRSSLTDKLESLEAEVKGTVQSAKETVEGTISTVKETVENAKETVKRTFDIPYQVDRHPWAMVGLSLFSGAVVGALIGRRTGPDHRMARRMAEASREPPVNGATPAAAWSRLSGEEPARPGFVDKLGGRLADELEKGKDLAINAVAGVVENVIRRSIPALSTAVENVLSNAAASVGAPPQQYGEERRESFVDTGYQNPPKY
jgi:ElaB/YqjD/DUF883 family membrane-anchored ribosome-binding protein